MTAAKNPLDKLPELPLEKFESIGSLELSDFGPFLTIKPPRVEAPPPSAPPLDEKIKTSRKVQIHFAWVTYPVVVCHDPGPFIDDLQIADHSPGGSRLARLDDEFRDAGRVDHYRLSALAGRTFPRPLWCTVTYGPWYGHFEEQESCTEGDYQSQWEFSLWGVQTDLGVVSWIGGNTDMPAVANLEVNWGTFQSKPPRSAPCGGPGFPKDPEHPA